MLWVSELPVPRWPPCADVLDSAVRHLVFIYIYGPPPLTLTPLLLWLSIYSKFSIVHQTKQAQSPFYAAVLIANCSPDLNV